MAVQLVPFVAPAAGGAAKLVAALKGLGYLTTGLTAASAFPYFSIRIAFEEIY